MEVAKDESILGFLARLSSELDPRLWRIVDHWEIDLHAIGIARPDDPGVLVYVSTWRQRPGRYDCSLELPPLPGGDVPFRSVGEKDGIEFPDVLRLIQEHLSKAARC